MYPYLLFAHSGLRWLVVISLVLALFFGVRGLLGRRAFTPRINTLRHITATIAHLQLMVGFTLYFKSPVVAYYAFFGWIHVLLMTIAVILITIGSSAAKRAHNDRNKYLLMTAWFAIAAVVIFIAVPWPFSPLAQRPYFRII
jgi:hypothetical protein